MLLLKSVTPNLITFELLGIKFCFLCLWTKYIDKKKTKNITKNKNNTKNMDKIKFNATIFKFSPSDIF